MASMPYGHAYNSKYLRTLETPEGVKLGLEIASYGARVGAFLLDMVIIWAIMLVSALVIGIGGASAGKEVGANVASALFLIILFILNNFWFALFEMGPKGATPGKRVARLRVVARDGGRLAASSIVTRNLMRSMEGILPIFFMLGQTFSSDNVIYGFLSAGWILFFTLFPLFNKDRMRVGDLLAGTWVIRVPKYEAGHDLSEAKVPQAERFQFSEEQLAAYGAFELQTLEGVLRGRDSSAAAIVAETIRNKIGWPYEYDDRAFLTAYYNAVRSRLERGMLFGRRKKDKFDQ